MNLILRSVSSFIAAAMTCILFFDAFGLCDAQVFAGMLPNDPLFSNQWYLQNTGQSGGSVGADINVVPYWDFAANKNLGSGVNIAIVDDGLQHTHPDIQPNYRPNLSHDFNGGDTDPSPTGANTHGTAVAGIVAARGNNGVGITGVAPLAGLSGIRLTASSTSDEQQAAALTFQNNNQGGLGTNHIYNNSWGPAGLTPIAPGPLTKAALASGTTDGRDGKGSIFVWAAGNGNGNLDNANFDGYANSRYVIAVGATKNNANGSQAPYSEPGANLLVNAPSSGGSLSVTTTDLMHIDGTNKQTSTNGGDYFDMFGGTSAAAPQVSGVVALMLEANPNLGWRDVKHILVNTAVKNDPTHGDWTNNAAGHHINHAYGFGRVDAAAAATMAGTWVNVGPEVVASAASDSSLNLAIADGFAGGTFANPSFGLAATDSLLIDMPIKIETVEITVNVSHSYRGQLEFSLMAPSGTESVLGTPRNDGADNLIWTFTTVRNWDELATGLWTLEVRDGIALQTGILNSWSLNVYGTLVPEPQSILLMALGIASMTLLRRWGGKDWSRFSAYLHAKPPEFPEKLRKSLLDTP